jgi:nicotinate-nucleotide adenylyltransferase
VTDTSAPERPLGRLGILGGSFNPPHNGHLSGARHARRQLGLDRVLFMPVYLPPHKTPEDDPGPEHRVAMCRRAVQGEERMFVSELEVARAGPSYTVDTLRSLHATDPGVELTFIVGADMARTLPQWREPREVLRLAHLAVAERDGTARREILDVLDSLGARQRVLFLDMPAVDVSSTMVRERVLGGLSVDDLVPAPVASYIAEHGLYRHPIANRETAPTAQGIGT